MIETSQPEFADVYQNYIEKGGFLPKDILKAMPIKESRSAEVAGGSINPKYPDSMVHLPKIIEHLHGPNNTRDRFYDSTFRVMRSVANKNLIVSAIHNTRCQQVEHFDKYSDDDDKPGWKIKQKDAKKKPNAGDERTAKEIADFLQETGRRDFDGHETREDTFGDVLQYLTREQMTIDQVATEIRYTRSGDLLDYWVIDGATIKRLREDGYKGNNKYRFAQEIDGKIFTLYEQKDIVFGYQNKRADLRYRGYGYAYIEMALDAITSFILAMSYNQAQFNHSAMPRGILSFDGINLSREQLEEMQRQWTAMFTGIKGMWKTPIMQNKAAWQSIAPSNRDLEFNQYIQILGSFICSVYGIDSAELGLRLNQAQNVMTENQGDKIAFSKDRGLKQLLSFLSSYFNKIIRKNPKWDEFVFCFTGIEDKDQLGVQELDEKQIKSYKTVNEKRKEKDLEEIEGGDTILDPVFVQNKQAMAEAVSQGQGEDEDTPGSDSDDLLDDNEIDELVNDMGKSKKQSGKIKLTLSL